MKSQARARDDVDDSAADIVRDSQRRGLGSSGWARMAAIVLWSGFLGATCMLLAWLALDQGPAGELNLGRLSGAFFVAWMLALVPAASAALLAAHAPDPDALTPPRKRDDVTSGYSRHGC